MRAQRCRDTCSLSMIGHVQADSYLQQRVRLHVGGAYFAVGAAALSRGYNVLAFDGPGQGAALRVQALVFRPDWEKVVSPVVDFALTRPDRPGSHRSFRLQPGRAPSRRAAAYEQRVAALILDDGLYDLYAAFAAGSPAYFLRLIDQGRDGRTNRLMTLNGHFDIGARWSLQNGCWAMGARSYADLFRKTKDYTLAGVAQHVTAPTLYPGCRTRPVLQGSATAR